MSFCPFAYLFVTALTKKLLLFYDLFIIYYCSWISNSLNFGTSYSFHQLRILWVWPGDTISVASIYLSHQMPHRIVTENFSTTSVWSAGMLIIKTHTHKHTSVRISKQITKTDYAISIPLVWFFSLVFSRFCRAWWALNSHYRVFLDMHCCL